MKDLGLTNQFLGMEIACNRITDTLKVTQSGQIRCAIAQFGMKDSYSVTMPLDPNVKLLKSNKDQPFDKTL